MIVQIVMWGFVALLFYGLCSDPLAFDIPDCPDESWDDDFFEDR